MIQKTVGFRVGDEFFPSIAEAQTHAIEKLLEEKCKELQLPERKGVAGFLISHRENVLDILTTTERSKPALRKINGAKRKPKAAAQNAAIQDGKQ